MTIYFDMDGTIADFYGIENWLDYLLSENPYPYMVAKPLFRFSTFARILNRLQKKGYKIGIISWTCKDGSEDFNSMIKYIKMAWLKKHLPSVTFDEINIVPYGTPKTIFIKNNNDILFDDEENNRKNWEGKAYDAYNIIEILKTFS